MFLELARAIGFVISSSTQGVAAFPADIARVSQPCSGTPCCTYLASPRLFGATPCFANS